MKVYNMVGITFPGVTEKQIEDLDSENSAPDPKIFVTPVDDKGIFNVTFNQEMLYPEDNSNFDYSQILKIEFISSTTGRITKAENSKKRRLLECPARTMNSFTQTEKLQYYYEITYEGEDIMSLCEFEQKKGFFKKRSSSKEQEGYEENFVQTLSWKVLEHDALHIQVQVEFSQPQMISAWMIKDKVTIEFTDYRIFKSKVTGKPVELQSFEGWTPQFTVTIEQQPYDPIVI